MTKYIYHITEPGVWESAKDEHFYLSDALSSLGFIHCCKEDQIEFVLENWFSGWKNLVLLEIEAEKLSSPLVYENLEGGSDLFPHVYGGIDLDAIKTIKEMKKE